jgi:hypothetical protein
MSQQICNPRGIRDIGLASGNLREVNGIHHENFELPLEKVVDSFPIDPNAFHRDMGDSLFLATAPAH